VNRNITVGTLDVKLAMKVPLPYCMMPSIMSSTFMSNTEKGSCGMPSLKLWPVGLDKSKIRRLLPGWYFFGNRLMRRFGTGNTEKAPATQPFCNSVKRYFQLQLSTFIYYLTKEKYKMVASRK